MQRQWASGLVLGGLADPCVEAHSVSATICTALNVEMLLLVISIKNKRFPIPGNDFPPQHGKSLIVIAFSLKIIDFYCFFNEKPTISDLRTPDDVF